MIPIRYFLCPVRYILYLAACPVQYGKYILYARPDPDERGHPGGLLPVFQTPIGSSIERYLYTAELQSFGCRFVFCCLVPCRLERLYISRQNAGSQAARQPGSQAARQPGSQVARQPGSQVAGRLPPTPFCHPPSLIPCCPSPPPRLAPAPSLGCGQMGSTLTGPLQK